MSDFTAFLKIGFEHIIGGYDHLLFLIALVIVTRTWRSLLSVISAFTIAHSTTLILSALGIISLAPIITESLIAASITYVAIENIVRKNYEGRWIIAGMFGLIHGAGFSGHLTNILKNSLEGGAIWSPLIGFNVGIELGQMLVISLLYPFIWWMRKAGKEEVLIPEISRVIAAIGGVLVVGRIFGLFNEGA
ncbi:MAG: HupE/UreJ family protein [Candidatus Kapaibacterium sp.]